MIEEAPMWGFQLKSHAGKLIICHASKCPPEIEELLRKHKAEILARLPEQGRAVLPYGYLMGSPPIVIYLVRQAERLSLRLERTDDNDIVVMPEGKAPKEFLKLVRENKPALRHWIVRVHWFHIAKQVLCGEWDRVEGGKRDCLVSCLRKMKHPVCDDAASRLESLDKF